MRDEMDVMLQSGGRNVVVKSMFLRFPIHLLAGELDLNTFIEKLNFYHVFMISHLGQNVHNDHGIIPCFHTNYDFDICFTVQSQRVPGNTNFHSLRFNGSFFSRRQIGEAFNSLEYRILLLSFLETNTSYRCLWICIDFHRY